MGGYSLGGIAYMLIGIFIASNHGYFLTLGSVGGLLSAILAVLLWPLVFLGANLHVAL
jgi:hypothetical protein